MKIVAEYRQRAEQCERMAGQMASQIQRNIFLKLAASWRRLADQRHQSLTALPARPVRAADTQTTQHEAR